MECIPKAQPPAFPRTGWSGERPPSPLPYTLLDCVALSLSLRSTCVPGLSVWSVFIIRHLSDIVSTDCEIPVINDLVDMIQRTYDVDMIQRAYYWIILLVERTQVWEAASSRHKSADVSMG
jgi:hypothetical protein